MPVETGTVDIMRNCPKYFGSDIDQMTGENDDGYW
jgi:hypothetical protein